MFKWINSDLDCMIGYQNVSSSNDRQFGGCQKPAAL